MFDDLGDRMKSYEGAEAQRRLMPRLPVCVRIDGKRFSRFTQGLERPYDARLSRLMVETTRHLMEESAAVAGYTQSDEITLLLYASDPLQKIYLDGRTQKLTSVLASIATAAFNAKLADVLPEKAGEVALFDCRVWAVPNKEEAANAFLWRELDATKNAVSMAARVYYPHASLHGQSSGAMQELLFQKGVNFNDYPPFFKRGTFLLRRTVCRRWSPEDLAALPPKHAAHTDPDLTVSRREIQAVEMPPFSKVTNRVGVLFDEEQPLTAA
jgi:tRNA(His) guanylyltransferase